MYFTVNRCLQNVKVQTQLTPDIRFAMTSFPGFSASVTLYANDTSPPAAVTSEIANISDWTTPVVSAMTSSMTVDLTASSDSEGPWSTKTATAVSDSDITTVSALPPSTNSIGQNTTDLSSSSSNAVDVAYHRLVNLGVIVAVYSVVLVAMIVLACRRRRTGVHYRRPDDWSNLEVCIGDVDDDEAEDSAALRRYWDTRRHLAERQRLLDSIRVQNISSVAAGHLIDRLPEHVV